MSRPRGGIAAFPFAALDRSGVVSAPRLEEPSTKLRGSPAPRIKPKCSARLGSSRSNYDLCIRPSLFPLFFTTVPSPRICSAGLYVPLRIFSSASSFIHSFSSCGETLLDADEFRSDPSPEGARCTWRGKTDRSTVSLVGDTYRRYVSSRTFVFADQSLGRPLIIPTISVHPFCSLWIKL